ncbi:MAG: hypothetical protein U5L03_09420 [Burkholderiaceae bacterium]|nr:hypothetical protein [Burkholderiaceae bacterium]
MRTIEMTEIVFSPFLLVNDSLQHVAPGTVCSSGSMNGTFNNGLLPAPGTALALNGTLAANFADCLEAGNTLRFNGISSSIYTLSNVVNAELLDGNFVSAVFQFRLRDTGLDWTASGTADVVVDGTASGATVTDDLTIAPRRGMTFANAINATSATYEGGGVGLRTVSQGATVTSLRYSATALDYAVGGVGYVANGTLTLFFVARRACSASSRVRST